MEAYSVMIKGGNKCEIQMKENSVLTIYDISLSKSKNKQEKQHEIQLMYSSSKGEDGMIAYLSEKANIYQMNTKLEILPNTIVCFEAIGNGEVYLNGIIYSF